MKSVSTNLLTALLLSFLIVACTVNPATNEQGLYKIGADVFSDSQHVISIMDNFNDSEYTIRAKDELEFIFQFNQPLNGQYLLEPGDEIRVNFFKTPELNVQQSIRPDGYISLQHIGDVKATGQTVQQLTATIKSTYRGVLKHPEILVIVDKAQSKVARLKESLRHPNTGYTRTVYVRNDGFVSVPLLGEIDLRNKSIEQLKNTVNTAYHQQYPSLSVDILLKQGGLQRIYVLGQVNKPGAYEVNRPTSVIEALALAGGENKKASRSKVVVMRRVNHQVLGKVIDIKRMLEGKEPLSYLLPEDTIYVSQSNLSKSADIARQFSEMILLNGWGFSASYRLDDKDRVDF